MFVIDGKLVEHDSLIELKSEVDSRTWKTLVICTADFYAQLIAISKSRIGLDQKDTRIMRSLNRTLGMIKNLDPVVYSLADLESRKSSYATTIADEIGKLESKLNISYGDKPDDRSDITVSSL